MKIKLIFLPFLVCFALSAQKLEYRLAKPSQLYIGTPFHVFVDITSSIEDSIFTAQIDTLDIFILKENIEETTEILDNEKITHLDFTFQPFDTGEFTFPELEFTIKNKDKLKILKTDEFVLNIISVVPDTTQIIRDIAKPAKLNFGFWDYFFAAFVIALIIFLIIFLKKILKKKDISPEEEIISDTRPAYVIALDLLDRLKEKKLLENGNFLQYHFRLSYILRLFIEKYYKLNAVEMTTSEIRENLQLKDFKEKSEILKFLSSADLIKFAKSIPDLSKSREDTHWLQKYLVGFRKTAIENKNDADIENIEKHETK